MTASDLLGVTSVGISTIPDVPFGPVNGKSLRCLDRLRSRHLLRHLCRHLTRDVWAHVAHERTAADAGHANRLSPLEALHDVKVAVLALAQRAILGVERLDARVVTEKVQAPISRSEHRDEAVVEAVAPPLALAREGSKRRLCDRGSNVLRW